MERLVNQLDNLKQTPLYLAIKHDNPRCAVFLCSLVSEFTLLQLKKSTHITSKLIPVTGLTADIAHTAAPQNATDWLAVCERMLQSGNPAPTQNSRKREREEDSEPRDSER